MSSPNIKDLLTTFNPASGLFAIASGDGRIKIWDTVKGHLQMEFADLAPADNGLDNSAESKRGHLSLDYKCMHWVQLEEKKKKKLRISLLVLGTGSGDVLALDVPLGQLRWKVSDCHPGGVNAVSYSRHRSCVYTAGADGMVCQIDLSNGSVLGKFKASTKAISSLSISTDGKTMATASGQLKLFNCSDHQKIQKFSGHSVAVRCMTFSEDGKYIISSGVGERYVALWRTDAGKKQYASCVLSMEHPAVFLDGKVSDSEGAGLYVLAISELGICYVWYGSNAEDLRNSKPTKISLLIESAPKNSKGAVYAAKFQSIVEASNCQILVAYGSLVKPLFQKVLLQNGVDVNLSASQDGALLSIAQSHISQKGDRIQTRVTALDRANAEDAVHPLPKLHQKEKKRKHSMRHTIAAVENAMVDSDQNKTWSSDAGKLLRMEKDNATCLEDRLRELGIVGKKDDIGREGYLWNCGKTSIDATMFNGAHLLVGGDIPAKKIRGHVISMSPNDAYKFLEFLASTWKTSPACSKDILPWIYYILLNHRRFILAQESSSQLLDVLQKMTNLKCSAVQTLLKLSGRAQLIMAQINKAGEDGTQPMESNHQDGESEDEDEDEDEDIDELVYGEDEDESQKSSGDADDD
ncbi:WD repeat-containing protein 43 [Dioscorea cayenensis subsp. rotundata]|uniref:WD repeat-containing protein 43 n=1 Tax=Dioscorea cayennensis subsp. rotundata TaxID=55577 RepID=A0AB40CB53_DIOCR|nr:WD repeat-containing protein 43 [Dioscorea cayenensis subsp. rotundata]